MAFSINYSCAWQPFELLTVTKVSAVSFPYIYVELFLTTKGKGKMQCELPEDR